jgi:hypothetical protein
MGSKKKIKYYLHGSKIKPGPIHKLKTIKKSHECGLIRPQI